MFLYNFKLLHVIFVELVYLETRKKIIILYAKKEDRCKEKPSKFPKSQLNKL